VEYSGHTVKRLNLYTQSLQTITGVQGVSGYVDGPLDVAKFNSPYAITIKENGDMLIGDLVNKKLRLISNGIVSTITSSSNDQESGAPIAVVLDAEETLYYVDYSNRIKKYTEDGEFILIAGMGTSGYKDGPADQAIFNCPFDLVIDEEGDIIVVEFGTSLLRRISPNVAKFKKRLTVILQDYFKLASSTLQFNSLLYYSIRGSSYPLHKEILSTRCPALLVNQ